MAISGCRLSAVLVVFGVASLVSPGAALSEESRAGVVTTVEGQATVARAAVRAPITLKIKDGIFLRDRITTGEKSVVRVLLGGKATVTARERSIVTITEVPGTATIWLAYGRISVAVSKDKMKPGETVEIATPNSVAAIRGTVVIAEAFPGENGGRSVITVIRGLIDVTRLDQVSGRRIGAPVAVGALETITVVGSAPTALPRPQTITSEQAQGLTAEFRVIPTKPPAGSMTAAIDMSMARAVEDVATVLAPAPSGQQSQDQGSASTTGNNGEVASDKTVSADSASGGSAVASTTGTGGDSDAGSSGGKGSGSSSSGGNSGGSGTTVASSDGGGNGTSNAGGNGTSNSNGSGNSNGNGGGGGTTTTASSNAGGNGNGNGGGNGTSNAGGNGNGGGSANTVASSNAGGNGNAGGSGNAAASASAGGNGAGIGNAVASANAGGNSNGNAGVSTPAVTPSGAGGSGSAFGNITGSGNGNAGGNKVSAAAAIGGGSATSATAGAVPSLGAGNAVKGGGAITLVTGGGALAPALGTSGGGSPVGNPGKGGGNSGGNGEIGRASRERV